MARRNQYTFSKRQREILKKKKAEEKRAKKRARTLGEMEATVDEFGNPVSTAPEPTDEEVTEEGVEGTEGAESDAETREPTPEV